MIQQEIESIDAELRRFYTVVGEKYIAWLLKTEKIPEIDIGDSFTVMKPKIARKESLEDKLKKLEQLDEQQKKAAEKLKYEAEYQAQKAKLDKALAMEIIDREEYDARLEKYKSKVENFNQFVKIQKQFELGLIDEHERKVRLFELGITADS